MILTLMSYEIRHWRVMVFSTQIWPNCLLVVKKLFNTFTRLFDGLTTAYTFTDFLR